VTQATIDLTEAYFLAIEKANAAKKVNVQNLGVSNLPQGREVEKVLLAKPFGSARCVGLDERIIYLRQCQKIG
jgi:hypothetical protein